MVASELYKCKIICVTESHLNPSVFDSEIYIPNYQIFRKDRNNGKKCGGSVIYVHNSLGATSIKSFNAPDSLAVQVNFDTCTIVLCCVYRSMNLTSTEDAEVFNQIKSLSVLPNQELILVGDFNLPDVSWNSGKVKAPKDTIDKSLILQRSYLTLFHEMNLQWCLNDDNITRSRLLSNGILQESCLDQVLVSNPALIFDIKTLSKLGKSDHYGVLCSIKVTNNVDYFRSVKPNWSKFDSSTISDLGRDINWCYSNSDLSVEEMWGELYTKLKSILKLVPTVKVKSTKNGMVLAKPPWDTTALKRKRREKDKAWAIFDSTPTSFNLNVALSKQSLYDKKQSQVMIKYENHIISDMKTNPKRFFAYLKSKRKIKQSVTALKTADGGLTNSSEEAANVLAEFFSSTFCKESFGPMPNKCYSKSNNCNISNLEFSEEEVRDALSQLNQSKAFGPDEIHPKLLVSLSKNHQFVMALTKLFKNCYESGRMPNLWKVANITAIHKKGPTINAENYRPISITCILSKMYERFIRSHLLDHVGDKIVNNQHGFLKGKSCLSNLLECIDKINDIIASGDGVDIFYMDFQKAFDTVPHYRLMIKLQNIGVSGKLLDVVMNFLADRSFSVHVGDSKSKSHSIPSGIPQGSVLGPLLFLLYINDLPGELHNYVSLFADDLKMFAPSSTPVRNQDDLDSLSNWQDMWLLKFNVVDEKCKVMHIGKDNLNHQYRLGENNLPVVLHEKDLGVTVTHTLQWDNHIENCINKAKQCIGWISRSVISRSASVMVTIYKSLIRPHLEYCVQLWSPYPRYGNWGIIMSIENVQRTFTRLIDEIGLLTYEERLKKLNLTTLLERRARGDLIETYRIASGIANYGGNLFSVSPSGRLVIPTISSNATNQDFLSRRVVGYWNKLPANVKQANSVENFKKRLEYYKSSTIKNIYSKPMGNYWELSQEIFNRINNDSRESYTNFMVDNPHIAVCKGVNVRR